MQLYLRELVKILDKEDRNWRTYTCIVHDGARYATHDSFRALLEELKLPFATSAPHSYNVSWVELLFGALKTNQLDTTD